MPITLERVPPERDETASPVAGAGACCCCCCCCLHSVGSVIGAISARPPELPVCEFPTATVGTPATPPRYSANRDYWMSLFVVCAVVMPLMASSSEFRSGGEVAVTAALVFPAFQLMASAVALVPTLLSRRPGREQRLSHLGSITVRSLVYGFIGLALMIPLAVALTLV